MRATTICLACLALLANLGFTFTSRMVKKLEWAEMAQLAVLRQQR
jgi:hypothetical protein